jgi:hypothetical protein
MDLGTLAGEHDPITVFQISDGVRERGERNCVRSEEHLALAVSDSQRRPFARSDQKIVFAGEQESQCESAA